MLGNNGIEFLLNFPQKPRWIHAWKIPVNVLVNDLDQRQKLGHG